MGAEQGGGDAVFYRIFPAEDPGKLVPILGAKRKGRRPGGYKGPGGADPDDPDSGTRVQYPPGQEAAAYAFVQQPGENFEEEPGTPIYIRRTEEPQGEGEAEINAPEPEGNFSVTVGF
jgi:hypothetical protein